MKKNIRFIALLLMLIMAFSVLGIQAAADEVTFVLAGDVDKNNKIELNDARTILRIAVKIQVNVTDEMQRIADFNGDNKVTTSDARSVLRIAVKLDKHPDIVDTVPADIKTDLLTTYIDIMNNAKAEKPGFTRYTYKTMPDNSTDRVIKKKDLTGLLLDNVFNSFEDLDFLISEDNAKKDADSYAPGNDMKAFPMYNSDKGCFLMNASLLKSADYVAYTNGTAQITLVLKDEKEPKDPSKDGTINSLTGLMFEHMTTKEIETLLSARAFDTKVKSYEFTRNYHDCTIVITYKQNTKEIVSLEQTLVCAVDFSGKSLGISQISFVQNIYNTTKFVDFIYK